ncbi:MAG: lasso peptide biosynthesis PqqD family chaperone [Bacteroidales bacterium]|nr:lasso peptide biosynthesis PqqD family chaperone [Bacteroidales bacterium]
MGIFADKKEITPDTILQRKSDLLFNQIDGEVVMLSIENSEYYGMDKVGSRIWELLEQPVSFKELVGKLIKEYEVSEKQCIEDTLAFLKKLKDKKILLIE